ncbi:ABC-ATPase domain-containing protein [Staphylococcus epidermidis]|uniref:ABC-ATPase domain-containing protein n=1 Tax=Staphylococcus epidermidis TaxID=1282 RepID=UPI0005FA96B7|nr:ABC-ATPase domain-containing protein [Staphylococcus epidermidis]
MKSAQALEQTLTSLDGQKYGAYKQIKDIYEFNLFKLRVDHIQADPFAPPSKMSVVIDRQQAKFPDSLLNSELKQRAVSDYLARVFHKQIQSIVAQDKKVSKIQIDSCGQEILERTAVVIKNHQIEARIEVGLPARGRTILGRIARHTLINVLPQIVEHALCYRNINGSQLQQQVELMMDQEEIRQQLVKRDLVAFVANGAILPRKSGVSDLPMNNAIAFKSPKQYEIVMKLSSGKVIKGMGIPKGITLIVGGGYHGKSTLLEALERGVYNHIAGDGREYVITNQDAMKIRAEDGRSIQNVNIQPFIDHLPGEKDTTHFSTENASGSTSQAANVMEALESQASLLLIDEDTSATNFMIRDGRMQRLIAPEKEPITPFSNKVKALYDDHNVSTILIVGGSGDYFDVADQVLMMDEYVLKDVTQHAKDIAQSDGYQRKVSSHNQFGHISSRIPLRASFNQKGKRDRFKAKGLNVVTYGKETIHISGLEQLVDDSQTQGLAMMLSYVKNELLDDKSTIVELTNCLYQRIEKHGLDVISNHHGHPGHLALPRKQEFIATLNRYRRLKIKQRE